MTREFCDWCGSEEPLRVVGVLKRQDFWEHFALCVGCRDAIADALQKVAQARFNAGRQAPHAEEGRNG